MARNAEKAMTAVARFRQAQLQEESFRPFLASECNELPKAEKWRRQIVSEVSKKVAPIQNAGLGEFKTRDLNDEINKLLPEKGHWEDRTIGVIHHSGLVKRFRQTGYKYFGAAKDLPGVRELFERETVPAARKTRAELMKGIDADYYGYRDEDDGALAPLEQEYEQQPNTFTAEAGEKWKADREAGVAAGGEMLKRCCCGSQLEEALVRRKMELLQKYATESLMAQSEEARALLGL
uniref:ISY1 splicing factor homolog n=1 Tax=Sinocyclocheilus anshuiensis TaxID=1608454 RepID=A0A671L145_9TELE